MKFENNSSKQFQPHGNNAGVQLDDTALDAISAGDKDAVKVLLAPIAAMIDDAINAIAAIFKKK